MKVIVITTPTAVADECKVIHDLFTAGMECLHVRKPNFDAVQMETFLQAIPSQWHASLMLHDHYELATKYSTMGIHVSSIKRKTYAKEQMKDWKQTSFYLSTSIHSPGECAEVCELFDYAFAGPVFESISKQGYVPKVNWLEEINTLAKHACQVIAIGGMTPEKVETIQASHFDGIALLGSIWNNVGEAVNTLQRCRENVLL